ncbi:glycosyltransferase WbuB [Paenibacillus glucanolyticus]|uniref:Glycosyltransferase WbuB n=1 Tax=Paenibacillus glucanolyticus TaxID=59843 RepID=A0A163GZ98_9BACL|nr:MULTISPECIES: glycosyltransferase family 4 protein [Paenibacillus]AWP25949.1 glycosyltransferase WbuB [Paenibacillus sp. Cedars]KZS45228.1 glycosyltransferase WbuB [Paenibacillus glucanolyticus]MPY18620.1 glycosyltransferase family 4 protein [Paenibacillus glucanolyticus]OMF77480.1 glycosyltransferase WbuB [Paenibacillus glucanolyticus]
MKKEIVFVANYFHPDYASSGQLLTELCLELQHDFDVTVIAVQPENVDLGKRNKLFEYDQLEQIRVIRLRTPKVDKRSKFSRVMFILSYFILAVIALLRIKKVDVIYTISSPPIIGGLVGAIGKVLKRGKLVYNIMDFNPEQAEAISYTNRKWLFSLAKKIDNLSCSVSDHIITVGQDMQETLNHRFRGRRVPSNSVINNWTDEQDIIPLPRSHAQVSKFVREHDLQGKFIVMYSGNLGLYYDLENIIRVASDFKDHPEILFVFIGDGAVKPEMQRYVKDKGLQNVRFLPFQPKEHIKYSLCAADVHLVVNQKGIKGVSVPSKIYGVMAAGKPILGVLEQGSEAAVLIKESGCGVVIEPQQYHEISEHIANMYACGQETLELTGRGGRLYLERYLAKSQSIDKYRTLLQSI